MKRGEEEDEGRKRMKRMKRIGDGKGGELMTE